MKNLDKITINIKPEFKKQLIRKAAELTLKTNESVTITKLIVDLLIKEFKLKSETEK